MHLPALARSSALILVAIAGAAFAQETAAKGEQLPIKGITLYRSGVGSFERRGMIDGDKTVQLRFNTDQINDILKSMIVLDLSKNGRVDGVSYGSRDPLAKRLSSFGVDISDEPALGTILARLRGAKVSVTVPDGQFTGIIVGGEVRQETRGASPTPVGVPYLNILTGAGIKSLNLTIASAIEILDKDLAAELQRALGAVAEHRADRTKTVDVSLSGEGSREIVVAYVQEAPVWKASYRLILPDATAAETKAAAAIKDQMTLQGWAIVENTTDEDWNNVTLSLVSGQPVSFRMDLYQPLYATRPLVAVPTVPGVAPRIFEGGRVAEEGKRVDFAGGGVLETLNATGGLSEKQMYYSQVSPPAPAAAPLVRLKSAEMAEYSPTSQARGVESGEIFEYQLDHPITVERQRSAMLPIISSALSGRRVSIFNPNEGSTHPVRGVEVTNNTTLQLLPGPISVYDGGAYAGDAQIGHVPPGDKRLLAYSVDLEVTHSVDEKTDQQIQRVRIVKGSIETTSLYRSTAKHNFTNKDAKRPRTIIFEHPKTSGWTLKQPEKPYETTDSLNRFLVDVAAGKESTLNVIQERTEYQTLGVLQTGIETLYAYHQRGGVVSEKIIEAVKEAQRRAAAVRDIESQIDTLNKEKSAIDADQARIRQNMNSIDRASELYSKYMKKLTEQEGRIEAIGVEIAAANMARAAAQKSLNDYVGALDIE